MEWCENCKNRNTKACEVCVSSSNPTCVPSMLELIDNSKKDMVNHPDHYKTTSGLETIDVIKAFTENCVGIEAVCTANVIKYVCRWKKKNGLEDLKKAEWYLQYLIRNVELEELKEKVKENE